MKVTVELDELIALHSTAKLFEDRQADMESMTKEIANLEIECERQAKEINDLRRELSTRPTTRELHPDTKTAIIHANDVLRTFYRIISSEENLPNETVAADRFHAVYDALKNLVSRFEQGEGLS